MALFPLLMKTTAFRLGLAFLLSLLPFSAQAETSEYIESFSEPVLTPSLEFKAHLIDGNVEMNWETWEGDFLWYKVIRSQENPDPVFPEDGYMYYTNEQEKQEYIDRAPLGGKTYYRICVITPEKERYCSNVVPIDTRSEAEPVEEVQFCIQVITPAKNIETEECVDYPTPCDIPEGWEAVESCEEEEEGAEEGSEEEEEVGMANPASVYCEEQGGALEIREENGGQGGYCIFEDGSECEEWEYYRGECTPILPESEEGEETEEKNGEEIEEETPTLTEKESCTGNTLVEMEECEKPEEEDASEEQKGFPDVGETHANAEAITYLKTEGIVAGFADGTFQPENKISRAAFTKIIIEAQFTAEEIENCTLEEIFSDVPAQEWFARYVCVAKENGIIGGFPDGTFGPEKNIAFPAAAKILVETFGFENSENDVWYAPYIEALAERNAIPESIGGVDYQITRGEMAEMIWRLKEEVMDRASKTAEEFYTGSVS